MSYLFWMGAIFIIKNLLCNTKMQRILILILCITSCLSNVFYVCNTLGDKKDNLWETESELSNGIEFRFCFPTQTETNDTI